jgi:DNA-directed RNA polymerase subunit beta'
VAFKHLQQVVDENHVMYSRDPALHRFSIMGAKPRLVSGNNIRLSPLVVKPFGADFDGDAMNMHLPLSPEAQREIRETMLPSKNLFSLRHKQVHYLPSQEFILGASGATTPRKELPVIRFRTEEEAVRAYQSRSIPLDQPIEILS